MDESQMNESQIEREVVIDAPAEVVWDTLTEPDQISRWFAERVRLDAKPGGEGTFVFERGDQEPLRVPFVVESVDRPRYFAFRWSHPEGTEPVAGNSLLVEFTLLAERRDRTRLCVRESGFTAIGWADAERVRYSDEHRTGWNVYLDRLAGLLGGQLVDQPS